MNTDTLQGNWKQLKGEAQKQWGKLTNDHLDQINGDRIKLSGKIQETYGVAKDEAEKQIQAWENSQGCCNKDTKCDNNSKVA